MSSYDALLLFSFGGPEGPDDVMPFLENVTRGRNVPAERLAEVAEQYARFGGVSPINDQNRALVRALEGALDEAGIALPVYFGNRNWHPLLADTIATMADNGHRRVLAIVTSAFGSYSGCRQYREDLDSSLEALALPEVTIDKLRPYWNHPGFIGTMADRLAGTLDQLDATERGRARLVFTAHSIPTAWTATSPYVDQLALAAAEITRRVRPGSAHDLVYQSRSGPPSVPWLEPDIVDYLEVIHAAGDRTVVITPLGFVSDHMEVVYDLDVRARERAQELGLRMLRSPTAGTHPGFVAMLVDLVERRLAGLGQLSVVGEPWECPPGCCEMPRRPASP